MTQEEFAALVGRLEEQNKRNPQGYKLKVILLAIAANAYLCAVLLILFALFAIACLSILALKAIGVKIALVIGVFLWMIVKALWVRQSPPEGLKLQPRQAPELFALIRALQRELKAPRFHEVLLSDNFNAGVVQIPRLGIFGWQRNYLLIGLPLMKSLTKEQFKAVLAHEFGHLAKAHSRFSNWVYRQRLRWARLVQTLEANQSGGTFLFNPFLNRFVPYFSAYSFPLARANEYEADATSVRLTSAEAAAEALTSVNVVGSYLQEKYWPHIHKKADDHPAPAFAPYSGMTTGVATEVDAEATQKWLERALAQQTTFADTHPCLNDRLKAIGAMPRIRFPQPDEAADQLLGAERQAITDRLDQRWKKLIADSWQQRHKTVQEGRKKLAELNTRLAELGELSTDETYERARLTESYTEDVEGALEQFRALHARAPDNALACFSVASRLLARDEEAGVALAERAMQLDHKATAPVCEALRDYYWRKGEKETAYGWHHKLSERQELQQAAAAERSKVDRFNAFDPHGLPEETIAGLRAQLQKISNLRKAWLVRKRVKYFPESPCYVLGFGATPWYGIYNNKRRVEVQQAISRQLVFAGEALIVTLEGSNAGLGQKIKRVAGARLI